MPSGGILLVRVDLGQHCSWPLNADPLGSLRSLCSLASGARADSATAVSVRATWRAGFSSGRRDRQRRPVCRSASPVHRLDRSSAVPTKLEPRSSVGGSLRFLVRGQVASSPAGSREARWWCEVGRPSPCAPGQRSGPGLLGPISFAALVLPPPGSSPGRARGTGRFIYRGSSQSAERELPNKGLQRTTNSLFQFGRGAILASNASAEALLVSAVRCR